MKKLVLLLILVNTAALAFSQNNKWFVSLSSNHNIGGPLGSFKKQVKEQGFNNTSETIFLGARFTRDYPVTNKFPNLVLQAGKKLNNTKSLYVVLGIMDAANVEGYKRTGYDNNNVLGGTIGKHLSIYSQLYQVSVGYMYSNKSHFKWGLAPSLFLLQYSIDNAGMQSSGIAVTGGATLTGRLPLGKEKRLVGVDLYSELNLAPSVKPHASGSDSKDFNPAPANLVYGSLGLALSFRR